MPDEVPEGLEYIDVWVQGSTTVKMTETVITPDELLHPEHARNVYDYTCRVLMQDALSCPFEKFRKAPLGSTVNVIAAKCEKDREQAQREQQIRDLQNQKGAAVASERSGGGRFGQLEQRAPVAAPAKGGNRGKGSGSGGRGPPGRVLGGIGGQANTSGSIGGGRGPSWGGASAAGDTGGRGKGPSAWLGTGAGSSIQQSPAGRKGTAPQSRAVGAKAPLHEMVPEALQEQRSHMIGGNRKGSQGRALNKVDLYGVLNGEDPGREISAAFDRKTLFQHEKRTIELGFEDEFLDLAIAAKAWMLPNIVAGNKAELLEAWATMSKDKVVMAFMQRLAWNKKMMIEAAIERQWDRWGALAAVVPSQSAQDWEANNPTFGNADDLSEAAFTEYRNAWYDGVFSNGLMQIISDIKYDPANDVDDWKAFEVASDAFRNDDKILRAKESSARLQSMLTPAVHFFCSLRMVLDPHPGAHGAIHADLEYLFPSHGQSKFEDDVPHGKVILKHVNRTEGFQAKLEEWRRCQGAEAVLGPEWSNLVSRIVQIQSSLSEPSLSCLTEIQLEEFEESEAIALEEWHKQRAEVVTRLRPGASYRGDAVVLELLRARWRRLDEAMRVGDKSVAADHVVELLGETQTYAKVLEDKGGAGLLTTLTDRLSEITARQKKSCLRDALSTGLNSFAACKDVLDSIHASANTTKETETLNGMRNLLLPCFRLLGMHMKNADTSFADVEPAILLMRAVVSERGILGDQIFFKQWVDEMEGLVRIVSKWRSALLRLFETIEPCQRDVLAAVDTKLELQAMFGTVPLCFNFDKKDEGYTACYKALILNM